MTISQLLSATMQILTKFFSSGFVPFITLGVALLALYGVVMIVVSLIMFSRKG